jgi:hypothetical protein
MQSSTTSNTSVAVTSSSIARDDVVADEIALAWQAVFDSLSAPPVIKSKQDLYTLPDSKAPQAFITLYQSTIPAYDAPKPHYPISARRLNK